MSPKIVNKEEKRREILDAAVRVFADRGLKNSRIADIAIAAGIGKGTIYEYFRNRDEMLVEAFNLFFGELQKKMESELATVDSPRDKIARSIRLLFDAFSHIPPDMMVLMIDFWAEGIHRGYDKGGTLLNLAPIYRQFRQHLVEILKEGVKAELFRAMDEVAAASIMMAIIDGLMLQLIVDRKAFDYQSTVDETINIILTGIETK